MSLNQSVEELVKQGKLEEAVTLAVTTASDALTLASAVAFQNLGDYARATRLVAAAIEVNPQISYYSNMTYLLHRQGFYLDAVRVAEEGEKLFGPSSDLLYNRAVAHHLMEDYEGAIISYRRAIELAPDQAILHFNLGSLLIQTGQLLEGLKEYEWRFKAYDVLANFRRRYDRPDWDGRTDVRGKTIVVFNEQGCGDAVQYVRYALLLRKHGARIVLEVQEELRTLLEDCADQVVGRSHNTSEPTNLPPHDYVASFMSLPYLVYTYLQKPVGPCQFPYLATKSKVRLPRPPKNKKKIGVAWAGSPWYPNDSGRSMPLAKFAPISALPHVKLYSLQKGPMVRDWNGKKVDLLAGAESVKITNIDEISDFSDTASVMQQLDLTITVDTTVGHLAGALNLPVWLLIPKHCDWRWFAQGETTPWYPSMRLFRQTEAGNWDEVLNRVREAL